MKVEISYLAFLLSAWLIDVGLHAGFVPRTPHKCHRSVTDNREEAYHDYGSVGPNPGSQRYQSTLVRKRSSEVLEEEEHERTNELHTSGVSNIALKCDYIWRKNVSSWHLKLSMQVEAGNGQVVVAAPTSIGGADDGDSGATSGKDTTAVVMVDFNSSIGERPAGKRKLFDVNKEEHDNEEEDQGQEAKMPNAKKRRLSITQADGGTMTPLKDVATKRVSE